MEDLTVAAAVLASYDWNIEVNSSSFRMLSLNYK